MPKNPKSLSVGFLFDDTLDSNDGVSQQVKRLGEWFSQNGHHVAYLCGETRIREWSGGKVYSLAQNVKVKFNGNKLSIPLLPRKKAIDRALADERFDIIHVQMPYSPLLAQRVISKARPMVPAIVGTFHILPAGWAATTGTRLLGIIQRRSLRQLDHVIAVSSSAAAFAQKTMGLKPEIIPNAVDLKSLAGDRDKFNQGQNIVFLGRLVRRKGVRQLIEAFAILVRTNPDARLIIAGDGPDRPKLERLANRLRVADKTKFLGFINEKDKPALLAGAAIACFPSLYGESFGIVLAEAMAAGAGVVLAGDNPGYRCVMEDQPLLLVDPNQTESFSNRMAKLLNDRELRSQLHRWQLEHVKSYDIEVVGRRILDVYQRLIAKKQLSVDN